MADRYDLGTLDTVTIPFPPTWSEDPLGDRNWRFRLPQPRLDAPAHRGHVGDRRGALPRPRPRPRPVLARGQPSRGPGVRLLLERPQHRAPCPGPRLPRECGARPRVARGWPASPRTDARRPCLLREPRQPRAQPGHRPVGGRLLSRPRRLEAARPEAHRRPPRAEHRPPGGRERAGDRLPALQLRALHGRSRGACAPAGCRHRRGSSSCGESRGSSATRPSPTGATRSSATPSTSRPRSSRARSRRSRPRRASVGPSRRPTSRCSMPGTSSGGPAGASSGASPTRRTSRCDSGQGRGHPRA